MGIIYGLERDVVKQAMRCVGRSQGDAFGSVMDKVIVDGMLVGVIADEENLRTRSWS